VISYFGKSRENCCSSNNLHYTRCPIPIIVSTPSLYIHVLLNNIWSTLPHPSPHNTSLSLFSFYYMTAGQIFHISCFRVLDLSISFLPSLFCVHRIKSIAWLLFPTHHSSHTRIRFIYCPGSFNPTFTQSKIHHILTFILYSTQKFC
jgi:hypothetical protein